MSSTEPFDIRGTNCATREPKSKGNTVKNHAQKTQGESPPVFFDPTGRRWRRTLLSGFALSVIFALAVIWVAPSAIAPVWKLPSHQSADYPRELLKTGDIQDIPLIGEENGFAIDRVALATKRSDGRTYLTDPFSNTTFRAATDAEAEEIGDRPYVIETFGRPADRQLMLTFDDGPDPQFTPEILDVLSREGVPATFFALGNNITAYPSIFNRIIREGHMVANHTMSHLDFYAQEDWRNRVELIGTDRIMRSTGSYTTRLFRIPEGDPQNNPLTLLHAQQLGYLHINMDVDTVDWSYKPGEPIPVPELDGLGHIVLMHDGGGDRSATVAMLEGLIRQAKEKGYTFSTLLPVLPPDYVPVQTTEPTLADHATYAAMASVTVAPKVAIGWLFWFGVIALTVMSVLYIILAVVNNNLQNKRRWPNPEESDLPLVSVILPVYNEEVVVARTLAALRASDYPAMEVIAVNDGSTDGTLEILRRYEQEWSQLRVIDQPNTGKSIASNNGIAHATGQIIITLDGDTIFEPQTVRMFARHFYDQTGGKPVGAVAGHVKVGNRRNILTAWQSLEYISGICVTRMAEGLVGAISIAPGACAAWSREALVQAGGYSHDTLAEDADLTLSLQRLGYRIVQENRAVAWTEAPMTIKGLAKQRLRWTYGNFQALYKHRSMLLRPRYGALGMVTLPYTLLSIAIPLAFMPLTVIVACLSMVGGNWQPVVYFAAFVAGIHFVISVVAIRMVRESLWHLLVVPIYRLIYEPLRAYLIYAALAQAIKGRVVGWYRPERTNSVTLPATSATS